MAVHIFDLFDKQEFHQAVADGYIRVQHHPELLLSVANYTDKAQFDREWNNATLHCRGLIYDNTGKIVARPFQKFFNYGEVSHNNGGTTMDFTVLGKPNVYEKADGSMGTIYPLPDGTFAVATRGSFASEQAIWATEWLRKEMPDFAPEPGTTQLVEIIYPANRIVVDYQGYEGLVSLAVIDNATGRTLWDASPGWTGDVVERHELTLEEALAAEDRPNREGFVLHFADRDVRVKIKHADYVRLHKVMTGASELAVWRVLAEDGGDLREFLQDAPDELRDWVEAQVEKMEREFNRIVAIWDAEFDYIVTRMPLDADLRGKDRKEFAAVAVTTPTPAAMFRLLDGKDTSAMAWALIRPNGPGERFAGGWD